MGDRGLYTGSAVYVCFLSGVVSLVDVLRTCEESGRGSCPAEERRGEDLVGSASVCFAGVLAVLY